jgi:hypothetical protein
MNRYQPSTPRVAAAAGALAMTALSLLALVVLPATLADASPDLVEARGDAPRGPAVIELAHAPVTTLRAADGSAR